MNTVVDLGAKGPKAKATAMAPAQNAATTPAAALPRSAPLSTYERARAIAGESGLVRDLPGPAVLVRLDERGGQNEAVAWAFPSAERLENAELHSLEGDDVFVDPAFAADSDEATATGPAQPPLPMPPARERASVVVVPAAGGRLGRATTSAVQVMERSISRQHALLTADDRGFAILDLDSDNGTGVNGMPLVPGASQLLKSGDILHLGDVSFLFLDARGFASHLPALVGR